MAKRAQLDEVRPILNEINKELDGVESFLDGVEAGADKASAVVEHGLEKVADVVPEALDKTVHVAAETTRKGVRALGSPRTLIVIATVSGVAVGAGLGVLAYHLQKKHLEKKLRLEFEKKLDNEINGMRVFYEKRSTKRKQPFATPEEAAKARLTQDSEAALVEEAAEALGKYEGDQPPPGIVSAEDDPREGNNSRVRYDKVKSERRPETTTVSPHVEPPVEVVRNVFVHSSLGDWDQDLEEAKRNPESPYVISHDEFMENTYEHGQNQLTYYAGDEILADEREQMIDSIEATVGVENLTLFGHGSRDSNIVYVRNERVEVDFEVVLNPGKWSEEVGGFEHSDTPRLRHGRRGDDG